MKRRQQVSLSLLMFGSLLCASARAEDRRLGGVVVESVERNFEAQRSGFISGDILLDWSSGKGKGEIESSFDIWWLETENSPRGPVTITGFRRHVKHKWTLGPDRWGLNTRPDLPKELAETYRRGLALARSGKVKTAADLWTETSKRSAQHYPLIVLWFMNRAATLLSESKDWSSADSAYQESIEFAEKTASSITGQLLRAWASTYRQRGDWATAERCYRQSIAQEGNAQTLSKAETSADMGTIMLERRNLAAAEAYFEQALIIRSKLAPDSLAMAKSLGDMGTVTRYPRGDNFSRAEEYYDQALAIQTRLAPNGVAVASTLNNLGIIAWQRGDLVESERDLHRALDIENRLAPHSLLIADSLNELGNLTDLQGDPVKGEEYIQRALEIRRRLASGSRDVAQSLTDIASIAEEQKDLAKAERCQLEALDIDRKLAPDGLDVAGDFNNLGYVARDRGDLARAEDYQLQAAAIEQKAGPDSLYLAETLNSLGDLSRPRLDLTNAEKYYNEALAIREKLATGSADHASTLAALAWVAQQNGRLDEAQKLYERALNALESQTARLAGSEEIRSGFRATHASYYKDYVNLLIDEKKPELALQVLERSRARMLLEMMTAAHVDIHQGVDSLLLQQERTLRSQLNKRLSQQIRLLSGAHSEQQRLTAQKDVDRAFAEQKEVEEQIRTSSPRYAGLAQPTPLTVEDIQHHLLDSNTLLLEYSLGTERSYVWAVSWDRLVCYELPKRDEIEGAARLVYSLLTEPNRFVKGETESRRRTRLALAKLRYEKAARGLSQLILGPVARDATDKRLVIVADGALQYVPFSALPIPGAGRDSKRTNDEFVPLVAEHEVVNLPSISVLAEVRRQEDGRVRAQGTVAVLADPVFDKSDDRVRTAGAARPGTGPNIAIQAEVWNSSPASRLLRSVSDIGLTVPSLARAMQDVRLNRLWFTRLEADAIVANTSGRRMKAVDFRASRSTATSTELSQYRIVHFATHGILDSKNPELSGLVFSMVDINGKSQNGFLDLQDVYNLNLPVEMVVLSACETGLGKEIDGEGLLGLTRGFMYAGASRVVASLWRVSDVGTAQLMGKFYKALGQDGMRPVAALRSAQIQMWRQKRWASPYYWAGFQIQGEWK
jgi:CHAT domain-containing protein